MLLIDSIKSIDHDSIICTKQFRADEFFFQGHFPENPIVPGVILCECAAQAGAVFLRLSQDQDHEDGSSLPLLTRVSDVRFKQMIVPGDTIEIQAGLEEQISSAFCMWAKIRKHDKLAASVKFVCTIKPAN